MPEKNTEELFQRILEEVKAKSGARYRPPNPSQPSLYKRRGGIFNKYYGTKFFCTATGAVYTLVERDNDTGLNILRVNRHVIERILRFNREWIKHGVPPLAVGDIFLTDAETVLLLRGYPLPHLGVDLRFITQENIDKALSEIDESLDALRDEIHIRTYLRKYIYKLGLISTVNSHVPKIARSDLPSFEDARTVLAKQGKDLKKLIGYEKPSTIRKTGKPRGRPKRSLSKKRSYNKPRVKKSEVTQDPE